MHKVFNYIDSKEKELINLLKQLVSIPTVNPPGENYDKVAKLLEYNCKRLGLKTKKVFIPKSVLKKYKVNASDKRVCLLADWYIAPGETLHINGHYDVVPVSNNWHTNPFKPVIIKGRIYGRGTEDMKGDIACYLMAVSALKKNNIRPRCNLQFSFTPDEEIGGETGFGYLAKNNIIKADYGIGEGYWGKYLSYGNKGVVWFKVEVKGISSHASTPHKGINSFERMVVVAQELMDLNKKISKRKTAYLTKDKKDRYSTMVLGGQIWGGGKTNVIPDLTGFSVDRRFLPEENLKNVKKEIFECVDGIKKKVKNLKVEIKIIIQQDSAVCNYKNRLSSSFAEAINNVLGKRTKFAIMPGATDMRFLMRKGAPCIGYSARGGERCHADDEYVSIKSLLDTTKIFAYVFSNFAG